MSEQVSAAQRLSAARDEHDVAVAADHDSLNDPSQPWNRPGSIDFTVVTPDSVPFMTDNNGGAAGGPQDDEGMGYPEMSFDDAKVNQDDYWDRLASADYDYEEYLDDVADAFEQKHFGLPRRGPKKYKYARQQDAEFVDEDGKPIFAPAPVRVAGAPPSAPAQTSASSAASVPPPALTTVASVPFNAADVLAAAQGICKSFGTDEHRVTIRPLPAAKAAVIVSAFDHMMSKLAAPHRRNRYQYNQHEGDEFRLKAGSDVPAYFANVGGQSIYWRKVLSIAGLRNLVLYGPTIYAQLKSQNFDGRPNAQRGDTGLNLMRRVTGNVVDLDTTVLRCDAPTLAVINASNAHKKLPTHHSANDFSQSDQAQEIARTASMQLCAEFSKMLKLRDEQQRQRYIHSSQFQKPIPVARDNSTRGHAPVWHYVNVGQNSFHANVPTMSDVVGALLKGPFMCAQYYATIHVLYGDDQAELERRLDGFFEDCVVDSCFNMKWKAIEEYGFSQQHEGSIVDVLQKLQMKNQATFTPEFFDQDPEQVKEVEVMAEFAKGMHGRSTETGVVRLITAADVKKWVKDPSVKI